MTNFERSIDMEPTDAAREWIMRLSSGDITEEELADLQRWREQPEHESLFQHELQLWRSLGAAGDRLGSDTVSPRSRRRRSMQVVGAIAACIALLAVAPEAVLRLRSDHLTGVSIASVTLPDGSHAMLDAGSAIAVHFSDEERRVDLLRGRAWFDVAHGKRAPFRVTAGRGLVEDIGTAFQVSLEGRRAEAAVTGGVIRVKSAAGQEPWLRLVAGQRASWAAGARAHREADMPVSRIAAWRDGDVLIHEASVRHAVTEIGRYRAGPTFIMGDVDQLPSVTAIVRADRPDEGLDALAASAGLRILRLPGGLAIVSPGT